MVVTYSSNKPLTYTDRTVEYNFSKQSQFVPSIILYKYVLKDLNKTPKEIKEFANITPKSVKAFAYDLNDDGKKEIIGVVYSSYYWGTEGYSLLILEKEKDNYKNITYLLNFEPLKKFCILNSKTLGYKDIKFYGSSANDFKSLMAKFNQDRYTNIGQIEMLKEQIEK